MVGLEILKYHFKLKGYVFRSYWLDLDGDKLIAALRWEFGDECWEFYNFIVVVKNFNGLFDGLRSGIGNLIYGKIESEVSKNYMELRIFQLCIEEEINESLDLIYELRGGEFSFKVNLNKLMIKDVVSILNIDINDILPRTKDRELARKIVNASLVYEVFIRFKPLVFFNKANNIFENSNIPESEEYLKWAAKIKFTRGYVVIFPDQYVKILIKLVYRRKIVGSRPNRIEVRDVKTVRDSLKNQNYSHPVWMKGLNTEEFVNLKNHEISSNILDDSFDGNMLIKSLNFLNGIKVMPNMDFFEIIFNISKQSDFFDKEYITKSMIEEILIDVSEGVVYMDREKLASIPQERINCLGFVNLVKKQFERFPYFYMDYRRDARVRIYNYNYPVNFQLSHLVRNSIKIQIELKTEDIVKNFLKLDIWNILEIDVLNASLFFWQKLDLDLIKKICKRFGVDHIPEGKERIEKNLELEAILILLESFAPKRLILLKDRITWVVDNCLETILAINLGNSEDIKKVLSLLEIGKKKLHVVKNIYSIKKIYEEKDYSEIFWVDASSNGVQLITLRLGKFNDNLLQLTNIVDNKTNCRNIYTYVTKELKNIDHREFVEKNLENKISVEEFGFLYSDDTNKSRIMTASYGQGMRSAREDAQDFITEENRGIWEKLERVKQDAVSDYLWNLVFEILSKIGFDLALYKKVCVNFLDEEEKVVTWYNDCNLPVVPMKERKSKRHGLLGSLNKLKYDMKGGVLERYSKIEEIKEKIAWDERRFYKRTTIIVGKSKISPRIRHTIKEVDRAKTFTSLPPNATHSYDASNMDKTIELMNLIGIKALPIFDSLGAEVKYVSIIKILFKLANLKNIDANYNNVRFPYIEIKIGEREKKELYLKILESSFFIR